MTKIELINAIRQLIADGKTAEALTLLRAKIGEYDNNLITDATLLESRYTNAFNDFALKGILPREDYDRTTAQINYALLEIVEKLEKTAPLSNGGAKNKNSGRILHNIPGIMPVGKEKRCIVRLAYDDVTLTRDLKTDENTVIQDIRIAEVMGVELLDFNETPAFSVRTITEEEQFVSFDDYTQWLFMVKALREGKYPLTLKVAVIEEVNGKERKRDTVLEKEVFIISHIEEPAAAPAASAATQPTITHFEDSNIRINYVAEEERAAAASTPAQKRFTFSGIASTLGLIVLALTGWVAFQKFSAPVDKEIVLTDDRNKANNPDNNLPSAIKSDSIKVIDSEMQKDTTSGVWVESGGTQKTPLQAIPPDPNGNGSSSSGQAGQTPNKGNNKIVKPIKTPVYVQQKPNDKPKTPVRKPASQPAKPTKPNAQTSTSQPKIEIQDVKISTTPSNPITQIAVEEPPMRTFKVKLLLKGEMKKAAIFVDGQPVDKFLKRNLLGTPQYIEFKSNKERHTITFKRNNVSCSVTDVPVVNDMMTVEPCSF